MTRMMERRYSPQRTNDYVRHRFRLRTVSYGPALRIKLGVYPQAPPEGGNVRGSSTTEVCADQIIKAENDSKRIW